jgi:Ger(x)C family germination protein
MSILVLSGCWDNKDINQRVMPVAIGISKSFDNYILYLRIPVPSQGENKSKIVIGEGKTINEIIDKLSIDMESNVDLFHVKVIAVDENLAKDGFIDLISGFMRSREISSKALLLIVDGDMDQFLKKTVNKQNKEGVLLLDYFGQNTGWNPHIAFAKVWEVYRSIHSFTRDVAIPIVKSGKTTVLEHQGSAIIRKGLMVGRITADETLLYNMFNGLSAKGKIEVLNHASVMVLSSSIRNDSSLDHHIPQLVTTISLKIMILETKDSASEILIKKELTDLLVNRYHSMFLHIQKKNADILGTGQFFRNKIPRNQLGKWRNKYYPELDYKIRFLIDIQNEGHLKLPSS